ncbi:MAG: lipoyl(octanoyl) transferase LipB [Deltaproteobacteria bacterium]|nr:lipoyl(octanoyl) transferase LipB [Deltaproteobacteria bacterium]
MSDAAAAASRLERPRIEVCRLGRRDYGEALAVQEAARARVLAGGPEQLLLVEHPPVITLGRRGDARHVLFPVAPVLRVNRGGDVTYHGPGQLVGYPILDLGRRGRDVDRYLRALEAALIAVAARFGLAARRRRGLTGVWLENAKLAAIGVGIRRWVTMHGFALNVADLRREFAAIVPCGLADAGVTSLEEATGARPAMAEVEAFVVEETLRVFGSVAGGEARA